MTHTPVASEHTVRFAQGTRTLYPLTVAVFCVVIILSNIGASKGVEFNILGFSLITDGGFFLFPLAYIIGDILSEIYGFKAARKAIVAGFVLSAFASLSFFVIISFPPLPDADSQLRAEAFALALGPVWQIVLASLLGFLAGQTLNSWVLVKLKERLGERKLWVRLLGSTGVGEAVDTFIFCLIAAPVIGITEPGQFWNYFLVGYVYKCLVEVVLLPVTYLVIAWFKRHESAYWNDTVQTVEP